MEAARQSLVAAIEAAKVGAPVAGLIIEYDNRIVVDTQTQTKPFLVANVVFNQAVQADLAEKPIHRFYGQLHLIASVKAGSGSAEALVLLGHFYPQLQAKQFGAVRLHMASVAPMKPHGGWNYYPILIPFWFDKTY